MRSGAVRLADCGWRVAGPVTVCGLRGGGVVGRCGGWSGCGAVVDCALRVVRGGGILARVNAAET